MTFDRDAWLKAIEDAPTAAVADLLREKMAQAELNAPADANQPGSE